MRFFIASPWKNKEAVKSLSEELMKRGHQVYSFLDSGANLSNGIAIADELKLFREALSNWEKDPRIKDIFNSELEGLKGSEAVILLQPAGRSSLLEAGIGYGMGKKIYVIGAIEQPEVFYLICEGIYADTDTFLFELKS
jgi:hypothetical protein